MIDTSVTIKNNIRLSMPLLIVIVFAVLLVAELSRAISILSRLIKPFVLLASTFFPRATLVLIPLSASSGLGKELSGFRTLHEVSNIKIMKTIPNLIFTPQQLFYFQLLLSIQVV